MRTYVKSLIIIVLGVFLIGQPVFGEAKSVRELLSMAKNQITEVTPQQVYMDMEAKKKFVLLDVRTEAEFTAGHIPQAINIPRGLLEFRIAKQVKDLNTPIVIYCRSGARGAFAAQTLETMGYTNVTNMDTAFKGWAKAGYPVYNRHGEFKMIAFEKKE